VVGAFYSFCVAVPSLLPPPRRMTKIQDAIVAETLTEIPAGKQGRVLYEGILGGRNVRIATWRSPNQKVYVVRREGTTIVDARTFCILRGYL